MTSTERMFANDEFLAAIYDLHLSVVADSKIYFSLIFESADALDVATSFFRQEGSQALELIAYLLTKDSALLELPIDLNPNLRGLLAQPFSGKPVTQPILYCRYALLLSCALSVACFRRLEKGERIKTIAAYGRSQFYLAMCVASGRAIFGSNSVSNNAYRGAIAKLADDPKQKDKAKVKECWEAWQRNPIDAIGKQKYKSKDAFAKDMLKYESLESTQVITRWCREWEKEHGTQPAK